MIAFSGSTSERKARISRKNVATSTASTSHGNQLYVRSMKSLPPGGPPPAYTTALSGKPAAGMISSRSRSTNARLAGLAVVALRRPPRRSGSARSGRRAAVCGRPGSPRPPGRRRSPRPSLASALDDRRIPHPAGAPRVDDDRRRGDRSRSDRFAEDLVPLHGLEVAWDPLVRARPELERQHGKREQDQERGRRADHELRVAHDEPREAPPRSRARGPRGGRASSPAAAARGRAASRRATGAPAGTSRPRPRRRRG